MVAYLYPQQSVFWSMVEFFLLFIWIWLLIVIFGDISGVTTWAVGPRPSG